MNAWYIPNTIELSRPIGKTTFIHVKRLKVELVQNVVEFDIFCLVEEHA